MKTNIGNLDKIMRILISIGFTTLFFIGQVSGMAAIIGFMIIAQLLLTSLASYCPVYDFLGISTYKHKTNRAFRSWN